MIESRREQVFYKLLVNLQVALFFSRPVCAISNQIRYTWGILRQKPNEFRAILIGYWAVASGVFGMSWISNRLYRNSLQYFEQHPNPIFRAFLLFTWGYLNEFPRARLRESHSKHVQALEILENAGESFWRVLSMQGLIHMDEYALGNGETYALHSKYTNLIFRIKQTPTILDAVLRHHLLTKNTVELHRYEGIVRDAAAAIRADGFDTIDSCYANISLGEINLLRDEPLAALPYLKTAVRKCGQARSSGSLLSLRSSALGNLLDSSRSSELQRCPPWHLHGSTRSLPHDLLLPKTTFITGEMLYRSGLHVIGRWIAQKGMLKAQQLRTPCHPI